MPPRRPPSPPTRAATSTYGTTAIRQFLDLGTGLPTGENVHQIAQRPVPEARVVYVDHDPVVLRELVAGLPAGSRVVLTHLTDEPHPEPTRAVQRTYTERGFTFVFRSRAEVERLFGDTPGLVLAAPGVVPVHRWNPGPAPAPPAIAPDAFAALDDIEKIRCRGIDDVTDEDVNVYGATGTKV